MSNVFYHQRNSDKELSFDIDETFWNSFTAYIRRMGKELYFAEKFGVELEYGHSIDMDFERVNEAMLENLGFSVLIHEPHMRKKRIPSTHEALSVVEFFFQYISKATETFYENSVGGYLANEYDNRTGRYEYTLKINELFLQNKLSYKMKSGKIQKLRSAALDYRFEENQINDVDKIIKNEVLKAVEDFKNPMQDRTSTALTIIANVLERTKTLKGKKSQSIEEIIGIITTDTDLQILLNAHLKTFTDISNKCNIRHQEHDRIIIEDKDIREFLFYGYYNLIRLILSKLNMFQ